MSDWKYKFLLERDVLWGVEVEAPSKEHGLYGYEPRISVLKSDPLALYRPRS